MKTFEFEKKLKEWKREDCDLIWACANAPKAHRWWAHILTETGFALHLESRFICIWHLAAVERKKNRRLGLHTSCTEYWKWMKWVAIESSLNKSSNQVTRQWHFSCMQMAVGGCLCNGLVCYWMARFPLYTHTGSTYRQHFTSFVHSYGNYFICSSSSTTFPAFIQIKRVIKTFVTRSAAVETFPKHFRRKRSLDSIQTVEIFHYSCVSSALFVCWWIEQRMPEIIADICTFRGATFRSLAGSLPLPGHHGPMTLWRNLLPDFRKIV